MSSNGNDKHNPISDLSPERAALMRRIASAAGRKGANLRASRPDYDPKEATKPASAGYWAKLEDEVDPDGKLSPDERRTKAKRRWKARMDDAKLQADRKRLRRTR